MPAPGKYYQPTGGHRQMRINVMLICKQDNKIKALRKLIDDKEISIIGENNGGPTALDYIENLSPDIIIVAIDPGDPEVMGLAERVILHRPRTFVILLADYIDMDIVQKALNIGAHNLIEVPKTAKDFADYIRTVYQNETTKLDSLSGKQSLSWISRVITVFGAKGGLGKTTVAANLAIKLAENHKKVALVDLDLQFGDIQIFLDIEPSDTIAELVQEYTTPNIDLIRSYMTIHSSGVHVLCAPKSPEYAEFVSPDKIQGILSLLRTYYDYVIIDTPPSFSDVTIAALEASSTILFITGLDISILKNSKLSLSILESLQLAYKVKLIVNRAVNVSSITLKDVEKFINCPIWAKIPSDYMLAVSSLNRGIPFVTGAPKSDLSQSISSIAKLLLDGTENIDQLSIKQKKNLGIAKNE